MTDTPDYKDRHPNQKFPADAVRDFEKLTAMAKEISKRQHGMVYCVAMADSKGNALGGLTGDLSRGTIISWMRTVYQLFSDISDDSADMDKAVGIMEIARMLGDFGNGMAAQALQYSIRMAVADLQDPMPEDVVDHVMLVLRNVALGLADSAKKGDLGDDN